MKKIIKHIYLNVDKEKWHNFTLSLKEKKLNLPTFLRSAIANEVNEYLIKKGQLKKKTKKELQELDRFLSGGGENEIF